MYDYRQCPLWTEHLQHLLRAAGGSRQESVGMPVWELSGNGAMRGLAMLTITREIWEWAEESQCPSEKTGDSIGLAGPDKERLNNPDLPNAVL